MELPPTYRGWVQEIVALGWDRTIGSVHYIEYRGGHMISSGSRAEFDDALQNLFHGDVQALVTAYYHQMQSMVRSGLFDVVGHFDVIKKHNRHGRRFDERAAWYRDLVLETIDLIAAGPMMVEINLGGLRFDIAETIPSGWVLDEIDRRGIPLVLGSDAHCPEQVGTGLAPNLEKRVRLCA